MRDWKVQYASIRWQVDRRVGYQFPRGRCQAIMVLPKERSRLKQIVVRLEGLLGVIVTLTELRHRFFI